MIVVDTNLIGYLYLTSERSGQAEAALRRDPEWAAPLLWRSELRNVLATYVRGQRLSVDDAVAVMSRALELMRGREYEVSSPRVLTLAARSGCSGYDCEFAALALELGVPLVTVDRRLVERFPEAAVSLANFVAP